VVAFFIQIKCNATEIGVVEGFGHLHEQRILVNGQNRCKQWGFQQKLSGFPNEKIKSLTLTLAAQNNREEGTHIWVDIVALVAEAQAFWAAVLVVVPRRHGVTVELSGGPGERVEKKY
jgi:hypothetical protein